MKKDPKIIYVYIITFIVAACSIIYELLLANELSLAAGNTVIWYSLAIGSYLGFLGIGSFFYSEYKKSAKEEKILFGVEVLLTCVGASAALLIKFSHLFSIFAVAHGWGYGGHSFLFGMTFILIAIIGFLSGIELPALMDVFRNVCKQDFANRILGMDYFGSLAGTLIFSLFLVSNFNGIQIGSFVATLNLLVAFSLLYYFSLDLFRQHKKLAVIFVVTSFLLVVLISFQSKIEQHLAKKYYYYPQVVLELKTFLGGMKEFPQINRKLTPYQTIDIVQPIEFSFSDLLVNAYIDHEKNEKLLAIEDKILYLNGDWQFSTTTERVYHEYFAHVPVQAADLVPSKVLILGGGDGMLLREILKYPQVEKVMLVELDEQMVNLAKSDTTLSAINGQAFSDPRVETVIVDAFHFLQKNQEEFDAVYIDFPVPFDYNVSKLYSREIYYFANQALAEEGFLALYAPGLVEFQGFDEHDWMVVDEEKTSWKEYYNSLKAAGFVNILPFFTNLEKDDMTAKTMVEEILAKEKQEKGIKWDVKLDQELVWEKTQKEIDGLMQMFTNSVQESFIFAQKKPFVGKFTYVDREAEYLVMTKKRFFRSFQILLSKNKQIEWNYVNSIMKPTLPKTSIWRIRFPYYLE